MKQCRLWNFIKDKYVYFLTLGIAIFIMIDVWIIGEIGPFGGRSLVVVDGVHQYLPFFSEYQEKLKNLESLQYSFHVGLGNNFLSLWAYYLSSPFNLIIILFSKSGLPMAMNIIISLKIILATLTFAYYLMHTGKKPQKNIGIVVFSLLYGFSSYVIGYYWNLMWLDCIFIFPIIILGLEKMYTKNDSRMYILALLYSFICNYYISFMICIFLILWFFTLKFDGFVDFLIKGMRFALASLLTAALSAIVLVPAYQGIMTTASAKFKLPDWNLYGSFSDTLRSHMFCSEVMTNQIGDGGTNLYCGIITILFAIIFFFMKNIDFSKKIKYGLLLAFFIISFNDQRLNYIWHGFHNQYGIPNRFAFMYIFLLLIMAYEVYLKKDQIRLGVVAFSYTLSMLFVVYCYYNTKITYGFRIYLFTGVLLTIYFFLLLFLCASKKKKLLISYLIMNLAIIEVIGNGLLAFKEVGSSDAKYYYGETKYFDALKERVEKKDKDLYRSDILLPRFVDEATWYNLNSIGIFGSTVRGELVTIMGDLGFYTGANEYLYYGATPVTNALFGVKYVYLRKGEFANVDMNFYDKEQNIRVYRNNYALPIGYMVNDEILGFKTDNNGPFTVQNELCGALTGIEPIFTTIYDDLNTETYGTNVEVSLKDDYNANYRNANDSARADFIYTMPRDMDLYINCRGSNVHKVAILIDGTEVGYDRYHDQIFHVGKMKKGQTVDIQFDLKDGNNFSGDLYCYPMEFSKSQFQAFYDVLKNQSLQIEHFDEKKIEGSIEVKKDGILMTSIPYDEGWTIYVNDKKQDSFKVSDGFLATNLKKGENKIRLEYQAPGLMKGFITTIIGIILLYILCHFECEHRKYLNMIKNGKQMKEVDDEERGKESCDTSSGIRNQISSSNEGNS